MQKEGFVEVEGGQVWYQIHGAEHQHAIPLLVLHGGPGSSHLGMSALNMLQDERPIIQYDQLGCGKSDRPKDASLWQIDRFVRELVQIRRALALDKVHILGHSWGTMLLAEYLLSKPTGVESDIRTGVQSAIFSSPCLSAPRWVEDANEYRKDLPIEVQDILTACEVAGTTDSEEYREATKVYAKRHICRIDRPQTERDKQNAAFGADVYNTMWGPSEFYATGNLKTYDRTNRLHELSLPTLFTCGYYDEASPRSTEYYHSLVAGSLFHVFAQSAHKPQIEQPDEYVTTIRAFLKAVE